jgi:hypothetical protein
LDLFTYNFLQAKQCRAFCFVAVGPSAYYLVAGVEPPRTFNKEPHFPLVVSQVIAQMRIVYWNVSHDFIPNMQLND